MRLQGRWRIVELPGYEADYKDMMEPAFIDFDAGAFAFGCVTGSFAGGGGHGAVEFDWDGNDEMDPACGHGWAGVQPDGSLQGGIHFHRGDDIPFIAQPWMPSSTAC